MMVTRRDVPAEAGFTLTEILVSLLVSTLAVAGGLAMFTVTAEANQRARQVERSTLYAEQLMERTREIPVEELVALEALPAENPRYLDTDGNVVPSPGGTWPVGAAYRSSFAVTPVFAEPDLAMVTVDVEYRIKGSTQVRNTRLQLIRTRVEAL